jgi:hypothetical protein
MLMKSFIYFEGAADVAFGKRARARLVLGDAPQVAGLHDLDIAADPVFTCFLPSTRGVLDDHFESWFLTGDDPGRTYGDTLKSVVDLGLSQQWLEPPRIDVGEKS